MQIADERIRKCLAKMIFNDSYWGYLFSNISRKSCDDLEYMIGVGFGEDNKIYLMYNPNMLTNSTPDYTIEKLLEHEGFHLLNKHLFRFSDILKMFMCDMNNLELYKSLVKLWNISTDLVANYMANVPDELIVNGKKIRPITCNSLNLSVDKTAEFYFNELLKNNPNNNSSNNENNSGGDNENNSDRFDDHSQWKLANQDGKDSNSDGSNNEIYEFIEKQAEKSLNDLLYKTFKSVRERGKLPKNISELIEDALKPPKIPYYYLIRKLVRGSRLSKLVKSYSKVNRKRLYSFFMEEENILLPFPGKRKDESFKIGVLLDVSGSMSIERVGEGLSGIKNIIEKDKNCETTVIEIDAKIQKEYIVKKISDIQYNISGRGGTELHPALIRFKELKSDVVLAFTDAECENINDIDKKLLPNKIIWVIPNGYSREMIKNTGYIVEVNM